ncbi:MAG: hypothetical protein QM777_02875 [Pseudorhodoferax sp.]
MFRAAPAHQDGAAAVALVDVRPRLQPRAWDGGRLFATLARRAASPVLLLLLWQAVAQAGLVSARRVWQNVVLGESGPQAEAAARQALAEVGLDLPVAIPRPRRRTAPAFDQPRTRLLARLGVVEAEAAPH